MAFLRRFRLRKYCLASLTAFCAFICLFVLQRFMATHGLRSDSTYMDEILIAALVAVFVFSLEQSHEHDRRRLHELEQLTMDLNHHIRNALQLLANSRDAADSASSEHIKAAIARIEWTLNEVLAHRIERIKTVEKPAQPGNSATIQ
jgi:hypothetical protein